MMFSVYKITNIVNGKVYIGQSRNVRKRIQAHISDLTCGRHRNKHLERAWIKYGGHNFKFSILHSNILEDEICALEQFEIDNYNSLNDKFGYNKAVVSGLGYALPRTEKSKNRQRESRRLAGLSEQYIYEGIVGSINDICAKLNIKVGTVDNVMRRKGLTFKEAVAYARQRGHFVGIDNDLKTFLLLGGVSKRIYEWAEIYDISCNTVKYRINHGWTRDDFDEFKFGNHKVKAYVIERISAEHKGVAYKVFDFIGSKHAICEFFGISSTSLNRKITSGLDVETAALALIKECTSTIGTIDMHKFDSVESALNYMRAEYNNLKTS